MKRPRSRGASATADLTPESLHAYQVKAPEYGFSYDASDRTWQCNFCPAWLEEHHAKRMSQHSRVHAHGAVHPGGAVGRATQAVQHRERQVRAQRFAVVVPVRAARIRDVLSLQTYTCAPRHGHRFADQH